MSDDAKVSQDELLREARVVRVQAGDVIVYRTDAVLNMEQAAAIREQMKQVWPNNECVAVSGGEFDVIRPEAQS